MKKLKKILLAGIALSAAITLAACTNGDAAKKAFVSDLVALNKSKDDSHELAIDIKKFKATGENASQVNQLNGAKLDFTVGVDKANKVASVAGNISAAGKSYKLDFLMASGGMYINSSDIKALYNNNKNLLPASAVSSTQVYDAMLSGLTSSYLLLDAQTMDQALKSNNETWSQTLNEMFKSSSSVTEASLTKDLKKIPNSDFTKKGNEVTFSISGKDGSFSDFMKGVSSANSGLSKSQLDQLLKSTSEANIKNLSAKIVINEKTHIVTLDFSGKVTGKDSSTVSFDIAMTSKSSKLKTPLTEPAANQTKTIADLENSAITAIVNQETGN